MSTVLTAQTNNSLSTTNSTIHQQQQQLFSSSNSTVSSSYASVQIRDSLVKFTLYLQKLLALQSPQRPQQLTSTQHSRCMKIIRLAFQTFSKYSQSQDFSKQAFQFCKTQINSRKSYYALYMTDLMLKNSRYIIKQGKKEVQSMFKLVWERVYLEKQNEEKLQNLKIMARCWGCLYGEKLEESLRKWLQSKYNIRRIQLSEQDEKLLRDVYGERKLQPSMTVSAIVSSNSLIMNSIGGKLTNSQPHTLGDNHFNSAHNNLNSSITTTNINAKTTISSFQNLISEKSNYQQMKYTNQSKNKHHKMYEHEHNPITGVVQSKQKNVHNLNEHYINNTNKITNNNNRYSKKTNNDINNYNNNNKKPIANNTQTNPSSLTATKLEGVNKSLLQALDLD